MITLSALLLAALVGQTPPRVGLPGDPEVNYREAARCYGVLRATATLQRAVGDEPAALQADEKARAFLGIASLSSRDAGIPRENLVELLRQSPDTAVEPLRGATDEAAITAFVERLNAQVDECIAFVSSRSNGTS